MKPISLFGALAPFIVLALLLAFGFRQQSPSVSSVTVMPTSIAGGDTATGTVTLNMAAPTGGVNVSLKSDSSDAQVPASVKIGGGTTYSTFNISTMKVTTNASANITATLGSSSASASLALTPPAVGIKSLTLPGSIIGSYSATASVTLAGAAPANGAKILLTSSDHDLTLPASITIPSGKSSGSFKVSVIDVPQNSNIAVTAKSGSSTVTKQVSIIANTVQSVSVTPGSIHSGSTDTAKVTVTMSHASGSSTGVIVFPTNGCVILSPMGPYILSNGQKSVTLTATCIPLAKDAPCSITASKAGTKSASLDLKPNSLNSIGATPGYVTGNSRNTVTCTVNITAAVSEDTAVTLVSSDSSVFTVPQTVTIRKGKKSVSFKVLPGPPVTASEIITLTATSICNSVSCKISVQRP